MYSYKIHLKSSIKSPVFIIKPKNSFNYYIRLKEPIIFFELKFTRNIFLKKSISLLQYAY